jgi:hypothetical protein
MEERRSALPTTEELRIWRDFIETTEALRAELTSRLQSESSLSRATTPCSSRCERTACRARAVHWSPHAGATRRGRPARGDTPGLYRGAARGLTGPLADWAVRLRVGGEPRPVSPDVARGSPARVRPRRRGARLLFEEIDEVPDHGDRGCSGAGHRPLPWSGAARPPREWWGHRTTSGGCLSAQFGELSTTFTLSPWRKRCVG